jgi:Cu/Ag efflux protein CusF
MKTTRANMLWLAVCTAVLTAGTTFRALADEPAAAANNKSDKTYTGTVTSVDPKEHVLNVKGWTMWTKAFNLGGTCFISQLGKDNATVNDLRAGEKVSVSYQEVHGVLIASRVEQEPMRFEGMVKTISTDRHTLTLHRTALDKDVQFPADCKIVLRDGRNGTPADIQVGYHVTVTYETPGGMPTAREVAQTSIPFTGTLTAIDLTDNTVKAKAAFDSKKFILADNCAIVINGRADGKLADLKPNDKLLFNYDEINGVDVVNRIAPANLPENSVAGNAPSMGY